MKLHQQIRVLAVCMLLALPAFGEQEAEVFPEEVSLAWCKELTLEFNPNIRRATERIRQQEGTVVEIKAVRIPRAAVNADYNILDTDRVEGFEDGGSFNEQSWRADIEVSYTVYGGGRQWMAVRAAEADERAVRAQVEAVVNDVLLDVDRSYYGALLAKQQVRVQEEAIKLLERQLELARNRFAAGARPRFDVLQAEVALQNDRPPLLRARNAYRIAVDDLRRLVGLPFREGLEPESIRLAEEWPFPEVPLGLEEAVDRALEQRPELQALDEVREATEERLGIAQRNQRPVVDLYGNYGANSYTFQDDLNDYLHGWGAGVRATWPFFDGGRSKGQEIQAESVLEQNRIAVEGESLRIEGEARRAYFDYEVASEILESAAKTIEQADEALRLANNRYGAGGATQLDVLQTQLEVTRARLVKVQADHDYHVAVSRLRRAVGMTP